METLDAWVVARCWVGSFRLLPRGRIREEIGYCTNFLRLRAEHSLEIAEQLDNATARAQAYEMLALACHSLGEWQQGLNFEEQRSKLIGPNLDVTEAFDAHL
jgi:hypothetical protein